MIGEETSSSTGGYTARLSCRLVNLYSISMEDNFATEEPLPVTKRPEKKKKEKRVSIEVENVGELVELDLEMLKIARKKSIGKEMMESSMKIPKSLRSVAPFLEEAQCLFR